MTSQEIRNEAEPEKRQLIDIVVEQKSKIDVEQEKSPQKEVRFYVIHSNLQNRILGNNNTIIFHTSFQLQII